MQARQQARDDGEREERAELKRMKVIQERIELAQKRRHTEAQQDKKEKETMEAMDAKAAALAVTLGGLNKELAGEDDQVSKDTTAAAADRAKASHATQTVSASRSNLSDRQAQLDAAKAQVLADERAETELTELAETSDKREATSRKLAAATRTKIRATKDALSRIDSFYGAGTSTGGGGEGGGGRSGVA